MEYLGAFVFIWLMIGFIFSLLSSWIDVFKVDFTLNNLIIESICGVFMVFAFIFILYENFNDYMKNENF